MTSLAVQAQHEAALTPLGAEMVGALGVEAQVAFGELTLGQSMNQDTLVNPGFETYAYMFWSMVLQELLNLSL